MLCSAWGDWQSWVELVARMKKNNPAGMGLVEFGNGMARISMMQREKYRSEAHFSKLHADFIKQSAKLGGSRKEDKDDGWGDD